MCATLLQSSIALAVLFCTLRVANASVYTLECTSKTGNTITMGVGTNKILDAAGNSNAASTPSTFSVPSDTVSEIDYSDVQTPPLLYLCSYLFVIVQLLVDSHCLSHCRPQTAPTVTITATDGTDAINSGSSNKAAKITFLFTLR